MNFTDTLIVLIVFTVNWFFFSFIILIHIKLCAKKKWKKNEEKYPYFKYPLYKKIFLIGLKGALNPVVVVSTFILNISEILFIIFAVWFMIAPNIIISYIIRVLSGIFVVSFLLKLGSYGICPPEFK